MNNKLATILSANTVGDGYDVRIVTGGETHTLHFLAEPTESELSETMFGFEQRLLNELVDKKGLDEEETD